MPLEMRVRTECVHAVGRQPSEVSQGLVTAKARLAKQGLTIPRLELLSAHIATNHITNVGLKGFLLTAPLASTGCLNVMLGKFDLTKTLRIVTWTARFIRNSRLKKQERMMGLLTTDEIKNQHLFWTKRPQEIQSDDVTNDRERLGLEENDRGIFICRGGVQVHYPVYLPDKHPYTVKIVEDAHRRT